VRLTSSDWYSILPASVTPTDNPACPHCDRNAFVRVEQIISGRRITQAYYCGRCEYEWEIEGTYMPERRQTERRCNQRLEAASNGLVKAAVHASLRSKQGRRKII
jgi:transposase-like protein